MIPLLRPLIPDVSEWLPYYERSLSSGVVANFGPCFHDAVKELKKHTGGHPLPVTNGTVAISVGLRAMLGDRRDLRVAVPDFTCVATLNAVVQAGMRPVIVGCHEMTMTPDPYALIEGRNKYDAFIVVSPFGYPVDFKFYNNLSNMLSKPVLYDLAGAWGLDTSEVKAPFTFSFHATKNFSLGEGGAVVFPEQKMWERGKELINFDMDVNKSSQSVWGGNGKMDEMRCAVLLAHLAKHERILARVEDKRQLTKLYAERIEHRNNAAYLAGAPSMAILGGLSPAMISKALACSGFSTRRYYYPLLSKMHGLTLVERLSVCSSYFESFLAFPTGVSEAELRDIFTELGV